MDTLHRQSGTTRALKLFAYDLRRIAEAQPLPEYGLKIGRDGRAERATLYRDPAKPGWPPAAAAAAATLEPGKGHGSRRQRVAKKAPGFFGAAFPNEKRQDF